MEQKLKEVQHSAINGSIVEPDTKATNEIDEMEFDLEPIEGKIERDVYQ